VSVYFNRVTNLKVEKKTCQPFLFSAVHDHGAHRVFTHKIEPQDCATKTPIDQRAID